MKARSNSRFVKHIALGLAVAAIAAPMAQAEVQPYGELYQHTTVTPYGALYQHEFRADGTAVPTIETPQAPAPYGELYQHEFRADGSLVPAIEGPGAPAPAPYGELYQHPLAGLTTPSVSNGIDWTDAGIGAAIALGALLVAAAGAVAMRRRGLPAS